MDELESMNEELGPRINAGEVEAKAIPKNEPDKQVDSADAVKEAPEVEFEDSGFAKVVKSAKERWKKRKNPDSSSDSEEPKVIFSDSEKELEKSAEKIAGAASEIYIEETEKGPKVKLLVDFEKMKGDKFSKVFTPDVKGMQVRVLDEEGNPTFEKALSRKVIGGNIAYYYIDSDGKDVAFEVPKGGKGEIVISPDQYAKMTPEAVYATMQYEMKKAALHAVPQAARAAVDKKNYVPSPAYYAGSGASGRSSSSSVGGGYRSSSSVVSPTPDVEGGRQTSRDIEVPDLPNSPDSPTSNVEIGNLPGVLRYISDVAQSAIGKVPKRNYKQKHCNRYAHDAYRTALSEMGLPEPKWIAWWGSRKGQPTSYPAFAPLATEATKLTRGKYLSDIANNDSLYFALCKSIRPGDCLFVNNPESYTRNGFDIKDQLVEEGEKNNYSQNEFGGSKSRRHWAAAMGYNANGEPLIVDNSKGGKPRTLRDWLRAYAKSGKGGWRRVMVNVHRTISDTMVAQVEQSASYRQYAQANGISTDVA